MDTSEELLEIADRLDGLVQRAKSPGFTDPLDKLEKAAEEVGRAWSGSWIGYQSRVYYQGLRPTPAGAHFSQEWGPDGGHFSGGTTGEWAEYDFEAIVNEIYRRAGNPSLDSLDALSSDIRVAFDEARPSILSIIGTVADEDKYTEKLIGDIEGLKLYSFRYLVEVAIPKGQFMSRDSLAMHQGLTCPPHIHVRSQVVTYRLQSKVLADLSAKARTAGSHFS